MNDPQEKELGEQLPQPKANFTDTLLFKMLFPYVFGITTDTPLLKILVACVLGITLGNAIGSDIGNAIGDTMGWGQIATHGVKYVIIVVASLVIAAITYSVINYFVIDTDKKSS